MKRFMTLTHLEPFFVYSLRNMAAPMPNGSANRRATRIIMSVDTNAGAIVTFEYEDDPKTKSAVSDGTPRTKTYTTNPIKTAATIIAIIHDMTASMSWTLPLFLNL